MWSFNIYLLWFLGVPTAPCHFSLSAFASTMASTLPLPWRAPSLSPSAVDVGSGRYQRHQHGAQGTWLVAPLPFAPGMNKIEGMMKNKDSLVLLKIWKGLFRLARVCPILENVYLATSKWRMVMMTTCEEIESIGVFWTNMSRWHNLLKDFEFCHSEKVAGKRNFSQKRNPPNMFWNP